MFGDNHIMTMFRLNFKTSSFVCSFLLYICLLANAVCAQETTAEAQKLDSQPVIENVLPNSSAEQNVSQPQTESLIAPVNNSQTVIENTNQVSNDKEAFAISNKTTGSNLDVKEKRGDIFQVELIHVDDDGIMDAVIDTNLLKVIISSKTGSIVSYYLKGKNFEESIVPSSILDSGVIIDDIYKQPFVTNVVDVAFNSGYSIAIDKQDEQEIRVRATANQTNLNNQQGNLSISKIYSFKKNAYYFSINHLLTNLGNNVTTVGNDTIGGISLEYGPGLFMKPYTPSQFVTINSDRNTTSFVKAPAPEKIPIGSCGIGIKDQYFCVMIETDNALKVEATEKNFKGQTNENLKKIRSDAKEREGRRSRSWEFVLQKVKCTAHKFNLNPKETKNVTFTVYAGPMLLDYLIPAKLEKVSEYGFLSEILMRTLHFFYSIVPNYGIAIILLTILVRIVLYPLTLKQTKSMAAMQKLAPKMQDIKDRYKDDQQKMNEEILKLYQKHNVNPIGGCLPLLLQMPILIALYNTIRCAVELRKTNFLWMPDLSQSDPYVILPVAIAVLMYLQQATQPGQAKMDPAQKQMMTIMPMMMFVITWTLPAGLLVYWFASSILGILQQKHANNLIAAMKEEKE